MVLSLQISDFICIGLQVSIGAIHLVQPSPVILESVECSSKIVSIALASIVDERSYSVDIYI